MSDDTTSVGDRLDDLLDEIEERRRAWPLHRKIWMQFRWKVAQPVRHFPSRVRWFVQRGRRGWSTCDMWGADSHIARVNAEMIAELRRVAHGSPVGLGRGDDESYLTDEERDARMPDIERIDAQIGFEGDPNDGFGRWKAMLAYFEAGWRSEITYIEDYDTEGHERFKAMLPLYGEWFGGLWD
jgi:hypothetical protein